MTQVDALIQKLEDSLRRTREQLAAVPDDALDQPCRHGCARGGNVWHLLTHNIEHDRLHTGQVIGTRDTLRRLQQDRKSRLLADLVTARAALIASLVGLDDEDLDRPPREGEWSIRAVVEHVIYWERNSMDDLADQLRSDVPR